MFDLVRKLLDFGKLPSPEPIGPFEQYRYPSFFVRVPPGQRAPRQCMLSAAEGVGGFVKLYPFATDDEVANVRYAFEIGFAPAIHIFPAR